MLLLASLSYTDPGRKFCTNVQQLFLNLDYSESGFPHHMLSSGKYVHHQLPVTI